MNRIDLTGQTAVVTGGAQGIGFAVASGIVQSGAKVSLWDMDAELLQAAVAELGEAARSVVVDITDADAVISAHARTERKSGPVSILVNSAGIAGPNHTLETIRSTTGGASSTSTSTARSTSTAPSCRA